MPPLEETDLVHLLVLWPVVRFDTFGEPVFGAPEEHACRWVGSFKEVMDPNGTPERRDATAKVLVDVARESLVWKGGLEDLPGTGTAFADLPQQDLFVVVGFDGTDDLKGRYTHRVLTLMRYKDRAKTSVRE